MRAFAIDHYKAPLTQCEMPDPQLGPGQVLVAIAATSVNPLDFKLRDGEFKAVLPMAMPLILGGDLAGTVIALGAGATRFKIGDEVFGRPDPIGTFAERIAVAETDLALKPVSLNMTEAASLPLVALTAWQVLVERAGLKPGQKILIHAGSGGVGTIAVQIAKHLGATVAATTSTNNVELVRDLGADIVIDYRKEDFAERLTEYDVVLNTLGPDILERSLSVLKRGGKLISISGPPDPDFARAIGANWLIRQVLRLLSASIRRKALVKGVDYSFLFMHADGGHLAEIAMLVDAGAIRPVIDQIVAFDNLPAAVEMSEAGRARGKIVVAVGSGMARVV